MKTYIRKSLSVLLSVLMALSVFGGLTLTAGAANTYQISSYAELSAFADAVNGSVSEDMSAGFDVLSFDEGGNPIYIEVKTTSYAENAPFYMSRKEYNFVQQCAEDGTEYQLHRVFDLRENGDHKVRVLTAQELLEDYAFIPSTYLVRRVHK